MRHEHPVTEVRGRIDALLGRTVFEFKSNLRSETPAAEDQLTRYLTGREAETGERYVGIATDGATFVLYELRAGKLRQLAPYTPQAGDPRGLLAWLRAAVAVGDDLNPTPEAVRRELDRASPAWWRAHDDLAEMWAEVGQHPDVRLKRDLWARLLERVYGSSVDSRDLFFQHTYLTIVAKTMAVHVLGIALPEPADLLAGRPFHDAGVEGAVESDFFDWVLTADRGAELVRRIANLAARFRLRDVETDVLKGLYESLIDPEQRHDLGEYYTPDWLAARMCEHAIDDPLEQRVLDPACGSGTFLFHAVRRLLAAADEAGLDNREALERCCRQVLGVDVHPVAVQIARVTYLLALGEERLRDHPPLAIPVYLGDSLQWNTERMIADHDVLIEVPGEDRLLHFPFAVARDPGVFDAVVGRMLQLSEQDAEPEALRRWLEREHQVAGPEAETLAKTYDDLRNLRRQGRNHIWGFVARNQARPIWLSQPQQRADVVIGNPPWLSYRHMSREMQKDFRDECRDRGIWAGGKVAVTQDLSGYFFARCVELYLKPDGAIAFVMPYAAMSRRQFQGFRTGVFGKRARGKIPELLAAVRFTEAWALADDVQPVFQTVPSCVLFARNELHAARSSAETGDPKPVPLPASVITASGTLPRRDATPEEAKRSLTWREAPWPAVSDDGGGSPYREAFRQGATMVPRMLCVVEHAAAGTVGQNPAAPVVESRRTTLEKPPWKGLESLHGNVEAEFLRPLYMGESVAPFRLLTPVLSVIPWEQETNRLLDAEAAQRAGYVHLAGWLGHAERLWEEQGRGRMTLPERWDYHGELAAQLPPALLRVVYPKSGTFSAAAIIAAESAVVDETLYWTPAGDRPEARYLTAILNSDTTRVRIEHLQSRGQWGTRDLVKLTFSLPIPRFDGSVALHRELAGAAEQAERVAATVELKEGAYFVTARKHIRKALREDGIAGRIDALVGRLLG